MATLNVTQFQDGAYLGSAVNAAGIGSKTSEDVTFTTSTQSTAFLDTTRMIRVVADAACYLEFGANPTAAAGGVYLPANVVEYFGVPESASWKVAAVTSA